jgi:S-phase kinase-associated protein 1
MVFTLTLLNHPEYRREITKVMVDQCHLLVDLITDETECEVPVDGGITPQVMDKIILFLEYHSNNPMATITKPITTNDISKIVSAWDVDFIALGNDQELMISLINAGNYLHCTQLIDLGILKIATMIKDKEPDEVKTMFHIEKDITPEEEQKVRDENKWVFELGKVAAPAEPSGPQQVE